MAKRVRRKRTRRRAELLVRGKEAEERWKSTTTRKRRRRRRRNLYPRRGPSELDEAVEPISIWAVDLTDAPGARYRRGSSGTLTTVLGLMSNP